MKNTAAVSRDHQIFLSDSGLISILGGKWTTYRQMAEDVVDKAEQWGGLEQRPCDTTQLQFDEGADAPGYDHSAELSTEMICPELQLTSGMVQRMVAHEMAETVADVLARRSRALFLDTAAALRSAGPVAEILATQKGWSPAAKLRQQADFERLAAGYRAGPG